MTITYRNLITGDHAQQTFAPNSYFEFGIQKVKDGFAYGTSEGEFLCAFGYHSSFKEAWFDALTYTTIGGTAYQAWESRPLPADPGTHPDSPVSQGFDPYAGNLDQLLGY